MSTWPPREYMSDDVDIAPNRLRIDQGGNGDWYLAILRPGERMGVAVRVTTSGTRSAAPDMPRAVFGLYKAMGGEDSTDRLTAACRNLLGAAGVDHRYYLDDELPAALVALGETLRPRDTP